MIATPRDRLIAAIGILQSHHLASDTALVPEAIYGQDHFQDAGLEHAINILIDLLPVLEGRTPPHDHQQDPQRTL